MSKWKIIEPNPSKTTVIDSQTTQIVVHDEPRITIISQSVQGPPSANVTVSASDEEILKWDADTSKILGSGVFVDATTLVLPSDPTQAMHAATKQYVDSAATDTFLGLSDTPGSYIADALVFANASASALEQSSLLRFSSTSGVLTLQGHATSPDNEVLLVLNSDGATRHIRFPKNESAVYSERFICTDDPLLESATGISASTLVSPGHLRIRQSDNFEAIKITNSNYQDRLGITVQQSFSWGPVDISFQSLGGFFSMHLGPESGQAGVFTLYLGELESSGVNNRVVVTPTDVAHADGRDIVVRGSDCRAAGTNSGYDGGKCILQGGNGFINGAGSGFDGYVVLQEAIGGLGNQDIISAWQKSDETTVAKLLRSGDLYLGQDPLATKSFLYFGPTAGFGDSPTPYLGYDSSLGLLLNTTLGTNIIMYVDGSPHLEVSPDPDASNTPLKLNVNGTMVRVTVGANDSGGIGYRLLQVPNEDSSGSE